MKTFTIAKIVIFTLLLVFVVSLPFIFPVYPNKIDNTVKKETTTSNVSNTNNIRLIVTGDDNTVLLDTIADVDVLSMQLGVEQ